MVSLATYYREPDEVPIYNFYKAEEDVTWLLHKRVDVNELKKQFLKTVHFELQEFFSSQMNAISYKNNLNDLSELQEYERKMIALESILKPLKGLREDLKGCNVVEQFPQIEPILKTWGVAVRVTVADQIETIERAYKGADNRVRMIKAKHNKVEDGKTNWMRLVVQAQKLYGSRIDPKQTVLSEWVEILKLIEKEHGRGN